VEEAEGAAVEEELEPLAAFLQPVTPNERTNAKGKMSFLKYFISYFPLFMVPQKSFCKNAFAWLVRILEGRLFSVKPRRKPCKGNKVLEMLSKINLHKQHTEGTLVGSLSE
jgi:hypothetical protein